MSSSQDTITYKGKAYRYAVKHFEEPSEFGYNEGRASKIWIERNRETVFNYDRGMDVMAADKDTKAVLQMLLDKFNWSERTVGGTKSRPIAPH